VKNITIAILGLDIIKEVVYNGVTMKTEKAEKRDKKRNKRKNGMRTDGKSVFIIQKVIIKKGEK
jgi:hypothetical protein